MEVRLIRAGRSSQRSHPCVPERRTTATSTTVAAIVASDRRRTTDRGCADGRRRIGGLARPRTCSKSRLAHRRCVAALLRILVEAAQHSRWTGGRRRGRQGAPVRFSLEDGAARLRCGTAVKGPAARRAFRRADTRTRRCRTACRPRLLSPARAHVGGRSDDDAQVRGHGRRRETHAGVDSQRLRQPEVEHLHHAVGPNLDVGGLQVAVDDALLVRRLEGLGDLSRNRQRLGQRQTRALRPSSSRLRLRCRGEPEAADCNRSASVSPSTTSRTSAWIPSTCSRP